MNRTPTWAFYPGQTPPMLGDTFYVSKIEHGVLDFDSGLKITIVTLRPTRMELTPELITALKGAQLAMGIIISQVENSGGLAQSLKVIDKVLGELG